MTVAPVRLSGRDRRPTARRPPSRGALARRRFMVGVGKLLLPAAALGLLALLAVWPELNRDLESGRLSYRRMSVAPESGLLADPRYRGVDSGGRPYTITARAARQSAQSRTDMVDPKGDMTLESGVWLHVDARRGVYLPKDAQLDLAGDVTLYREDGLTMASATATMNLRDGLATSEDRVHVEGPFGTLDAQGYTMTDKGAVLHFNGPGRLVINGSER